VNAASPKPKRAAGQALDRFRKGITRTADDPTARDPELSGDGWQSRDRA